MSEYDKLLDRARKAKEVFRASAGEFVPKMYEALRKEGIDPWDAKDRIEKDLVGIWEKDTIRRYIPDTAKNPGLSAAAKKGNKQRKAGKNPASDRQVVSVATTGDEEINSSDGLGSNESESTTAQWQKQYEAETNDHIKDLKERLTKAETENKELKTTLQKIQDAAGVQGTTVLELGDKALPLKYWLRLIPKFSLKLEVDADKARKELYA